MLQFIGYRIADFSCTLIPLTIMSRRRVTFAHIVALSKHKKAQSRAPDRRYSSFMSKIEAHVGERQNSALPAFPMERHHEHPVKNIQCWTSSDEELKIRA